MKLEMFQNVLVPVDLVVYAKFEKDYHDGGKTVVIIRVPESGLTQTIDFEGDCLKKFQRWYKKQVKDLECTVKLPLHFPDPFLGPPPATRIELTTDPSTTKEDPNVVKCLPQNTVTE